MNRPLSTVVLALLSLVALTSVPVAQASAPAQGSGNVFIPSTETPQQVAEFWTAERMAAAQPVPDWVVERSLRSQPADTQMDQPDGPPYRIYGNTAGAPANLLVSAAAQGSSKATTINLAYPFAFNRGPITSGGYSKWPQRTHGKLYFTNSAYGPGTHTCSGTSITSGVDGNKSLVLTAAHCITSGGNGVTPGIDSQNLVFRPGRHNGVDPNLAWSRIGSYVKASWNLSANVREDFGIIITEAKSDVCGLVDDVRLADCVGGQGLAWNQSPVQQFAVYGYPVEDPLFDGESMHVCNSMTHRLDPFAGGTGPLPLGIGCDFPLGGSDGGGWIVWDKQPNSGYVNSVTTHKYLSSPNWPKALFGPYFDSDFGSLWEEARMYGQN